MIKEPLNPAELILKDEKFGNPISEELSNYLRKYTDKDDISNAAIETGVGRSTVRNVVYRSNTLTEGNSIAIIALIDIAITNCELAIESAEQTIKGLRKTLKEKEDGQK